MDTVKRVVHVSPEHADKVERLFDRAMSQAAHSFSNSDWVAISPAWDWVVRHVTSQLVESRIPFEVEDTDPESVAKERRQFHE